MTYQDLLRLKGYKRQRKPKGQSRIDNPEKLATQDKDKQNKKHNTETHKYGK